VVRDPTATYAIGARFQTTLHFQALTVNGDPAVSAPELHCPFPSALEAIGTVLDAVSLVGGRILLAYNGTGPNGVVHYEILTANGRAYRPDTLPATLRKSVPIQGSNPALPAGGPIDSPARWRDFGALQFLRASGAYSEFPIVDDMPSLAAGVSQNGSLRFVDTNVDGLVDDGDRLDVNLAATRSPSPRRTGSPSTSWMRRETVGSTPGTCSSSAASRTIPRCPSIWPSATPALERLLGSSATASRSGAFRRSHSPPRGRTRGKRP